ncbi:MAG: Endonuclease III [Parcubacteria group bacterium GW2011_GWB1_53_43]|nr:MAG: Endonuclease III [Parcubacteria group bacterium GW2011_GWB1_53_43]
MRLSRDESASFTWRARIISRELKKLFPGKLQTPLHYKTPWQLLVAVILSAQCTDAQVFASAKQEELEQDIHSTGFYRNKARSIIGAAKALGERFEGKLPKTISELLTIPGVGRKTANVVLGHVHGVVEGIAVDTHVRRLARKFGLTQESDPNKIERDLMKLFPKREWWDTAYRLKAYGRVYSPARRGDDDPISIVLKKKNPRHVVRIGGERTSNVARSRHQ